jgi:hypothetical protein
MTVYVPNPATPQNRIVIVTYDLKGPATGYTDFIETLKSQGVWWHYLPSTWLLHTHLTPEQISSALRPHLQSGDLLFIGTLQQGYNGLLPKDAWDWIKSRGLPFA